MVLRWLLVAFFFLPGALHGQAAAQIPRSADERFVEGLRQRRLFELAERHCRQRLADQNLTPAAQADLTVELVRTLAEHAIHLPAEERGAMWSRARQAAADFVAQHATHPRVVLVRLQDALTVLAEGELARQEWESGAASALAPARSALREAGRLLEALHGELAREIPRRRSVAPRQGELSADELASLQLHVQHQGARAYRNQALLYEPKSPDRVSFLSQAKEALANAIAAGAEEPLAQRMKLELASCERLLDHPQEARAILAELDREGLAAEGRLGARAELLRLELAQDRRDAAQEIARLGRTLDGRTSAELDLAILELCLAQLHAATQSQDPAAAERWQKLAAEQARLIEEQHGAYWGRRGDQLLVRSLPAGTATNVELLGRAADGLYLKGELNQALAAYDQAAEAARQAANGQAAFDLAYKAALLQESRKEHRDAAARFGALARQSPKEPRAAEAHLRGAWNAAQETRRQASFEAEYRRMLQEQIATWPEGEASNQARLWLGRLYETRSAWAEAAAAYASVPPESEHFGPAIAAAIRSFREHLSALQSEGKSTDDAARTAVASLRRMVLGPVSDPPSRWTQPQREAAVALAEIIVDYLPGEGDQAERLLTAALEASADAPVEWKASAQAALAVVLALKPPKRAQAHKLLGELGDASPGQLLALLERLSAIALRSRPEMRRELAALQLATVERLAPKRSTLDQPAQLALDRLHAEALAAAGRQAEALAAYARLAAAHPNHGAIQEGYAELLLSGDDKPALERALAQWRIVAARSQPRTERWYKAKYSVALAQLKLGDKAGAATLLKYVLHTPPGLEGSPWKAKYEVLLEACR